MLYDGACQTFGVIVKFTEECLLFQKIEAFTIQLDDSVFKIDISTLLDNYVFQFVNVFYIDTNLLSQNFWHHCVVNKYGNVEGMLLPSIWRNKNAVQESTLSKHLCHIKKKKKKVKHSLGKNKRTVKKNGRSNLLNTVLGKTEECWHTIYVRQDNKSSCYEICQKNKLKKSFYIIVPCPLFNVKKEKWISFQSGFKYCYMMYFVIDAVCLNHMKKITSAVKLHFHLSNLSVGSVFLIQPYNCHHTRFCIVNGHQFSTLRKNPNVETMSTETNTYLYEYTDAASWSLPGCVVSSWETANELPEFFMKDVENLVKAVGTGTKRRRTKNRGIFINLGPRLSSRPRPNPVMQDKKKLYFSEFYRQNWNFQASTYLLRLKVCHGAECIRKRSIALNPVYMRLVGHHCCARQLVSSGICKPKSAKEDVNSNKTKHKSKKKSVMNTLGYVNLLHSDICDLVLKVLV